MEQVGDDVPPECPRKAQERVVWHGLGRVGRMVLLIPDAVKKLKREGRDEERKRIQKILDQVSDEVPAEVLEKLKSELFSPDSKE